MKNRKEGDVQMAIIKPFCGYRYNPDLIKDAGEVMAPPYDSLSDEQTDSFYDLNPYNAARLVSQRSYKTDDIDNNCYTRSRDFLKSWIEKKILVREEKSSIYVYEQTVTINRENYYYRGIIGLLELTDYSDGVVVPCENPSTDSKEDRFKMISTVEANPSLISCVYTDGDRQLSTLLAEISEEPPEMEFLTQNGIRHKLWAITYKPTIDFVADVLREKKMFIVDGHNRYEACLEYKHYRKENDESYTGKESYNYVMTLISDTREDGGLLLPVHRVLKLKESFREDFLIAGVQEHFLVEKIIVDKFDDDISETIKKQVFTQRNEIKIGFYTGKDYFYRFTFRDKKYIDSLMPDVSECYRMLDINVFNKLIMEEQLGIDSESDSERIFYTRDVKRGMRAVGNQEFTCMFILNPVRPEQFNVMTHTGERLPKRSISIFPKPATGIVIHKFTPVVG